MVNISFEISRRGTTGTPRPFMLPNLLLQSVHQTLEDGSKAPLHMESHALELHATKQFLAERQTTLMRYADGARRGDAVWRGADTIHSTGGPDAARPHEPLQRQRDVRFRQLE